MVAKSLQAHLAAWTVERTVYRKPAVDPSGEFDFVHTIATGSSATVSKPNATFGEAQNILLLYRCNLFTGFSFRFTIIHTNKVTNIFSIAARSESFCCTPELASLLP